MSDDIGQTVPSLSAGAIPKTIVLIGLMGAGKSSVGRRLAARLGLPFVDADTEIEAAAGRSIADVFAGHGEAAFRDVERRVVRRLLDGPVCVLATGGGAFIDSEIRKLVMETGIALWLRASLDTMIRRTERRDDRPLLQNGDRAEILAGLMRARYPIYAEAPITVDAGDTTIEATVDRVVAALAQHLGNVKAGP